MLFFVPLMALIFYIMGFLVWNDRVPYLFDKEISQPWCLAIEREDIEDCRKWEEIANSFPLQTLPIMLNPIQWVVNWNWKPNLQEYK